MMNPGSKYVQLLQGQPSPNNGTVAGGLGHVLQQALLGYSMGEEKRQQDAKQGRLTQALQALVGTPDNTITWNQPTRPDGTGEATTTIPGQAPNRSQAMQLLAQDNPEIAFQLANQDYTFQRQQEAAGNELVQVPNPNGDGSMIFLPRSQVTAGMVAENAPIPEQTTATRNAIALGLQPGSPEFEQYIRDVTLRPASQTTINVAGDTAPQVTAREIYGDPGPGLVWKIDPATNQAALDVNGAPIAIPYQGGSVWQSQQDAAAAEAAAAEADAAANQMKTDQASIALQDIDRAIELANSPGLPTTGAIGGLLASTAGGTNAYDLGQIILSLEGYVARETLQKMRDASPTGGALGNVSEGELAMLSSAYGSLKQSQSQEQLVANLTRFRSLLNDVVNGPSTPPPSTGGGWSIRQVQ